MLPIGRAGRTVWPWSISDTLQSQRRWSLELDREPALCLVAVRHCREVLAEASFHPPSWRDLTVVVPERAEEEEPNQRKVGWKQSAARSLETKFLNERVWPGMTNAEKALLRSQRGHLPPQQTALPTTRATRMDGQHFRVLLFRRLRLPLPLVLSHLPMLPPT